MIHRSPDLRTKKREDLMFSTHASTAVRPFVYFGRLRPAKTDVAAQRIEEAAEANAKSEGELKAPLDNMGWRNPDWWQDRHYERR
jgi:hypothetical protein